MTTIQSWISHSMDKNTRSLSMEKTLHIGQCTTEGFGVTYEQSWDFEF